MNKIIELARKQGIIRPRDLIQMRIPNIYLTRLVAAKQLERVSRGLYQLPNARVTEYHSLALVAKQYPDAAICLLSALAFHGLTTQSPHQVWVAIPGKARRPIMATVKLRVVRYSGSALTAGLETHTIEKVPVRIYNPAKTVADCFKYRHKIGLDVAIEALRESRRSRRVTNDDLWKYAKICRVWNVMRPYLEVIA
jgi:predicted transcriptional regulator of viral defense system